MNIATNDAAPPVDHRQNEAIKPVVTGALLGLIWGCSLRAWMALLTLQLGDSAKITW